MTSHLSQVSAPSYTEAMGKAEETKARVERAALTLFVARGVAETTTKEIAMAASIAEGTIYRYFPSKEQLALDLESPSQRKNARGRLVDKPGGLDHVEPPVLKPEGRFDWPADGFRCDHGRGSE